MSNNHMNEAPACKYNKERKQKEHDIFQTQHS